MSTVFLAIDVGNTNIVFGLFREAALLKSWRLETSGELNADDYASSFRGQCSDPVSDVLISSVVPEVDETLAAFCRDSLACEAVFVSKENVPLSIDMERPQDVGADRLVNALAVQALYKVPAIVLDFGTATTFDVVDLGNVYKGGAITLGAHAFFKALQIRIPSLPQISIEKPEKAIGGGTVEAMQSGLYWGYVGLIEGVLGRLIDEMTGDEVFVLATGGLASLFAEDIDLIDRVDVDLTLNGLYELHKILKKEGA